MASTSANLYSLSKLRELYLNNEEYVVKTVEVFVLQISKDLKLMTQHLDEKEWHKLRATAHKIKPNVDLFLIESIQQDVRFIEKEARKENAVDIAAKVEKVVNTIEAVREDLKDYLKSNPTSE